MSKSSPTRSDVLIVAIQELSELKLELVNGGFAVPEGIDVQLKQLAARLSKGGSDDARDA